MKSDYFKVQRRAFIKEPEGMYLFSDEVKSYSLNSKGALALQFNQPAIALGTKMFRA